MWIETKNELPPIDERVLVIQNGRVGISRRVLPHSYNFDWKGQWMWEAYSGYCHYFLGEPRLITKWAKLPVGEDSQP